MLITTKALIQGTIFALSELYTVHVYVLIVLRMETQGERLVHARFSTKNISIKNDLISGKACR